jgi:hypothetical protein
MGDAVGYGGGYQNGGYLPEGGYESPSPDNAYAEGYGMQVDGDRWDAIDACVDV